MVAETTGAMFCKSARISVMGFSGLISFRKPTLPEKPYFFSLCLAKVLVGEIHLVPVYKGNLKAKWTIVLSTFVDDWQQSELLDEIKKYAPHVNIPKEELNQKDIR